MLLSSSQGIAPLLNNPSFAPAAVWCWPLFGGPEQLSAEPPPMPAGMVPEVTMADFMRYLRVIGDKHNRFSQLRQESMNDQRRKISVTDITPGMQHRVSHGQIMRIDTCSNRDGSLGRPAAHDPDKSGSPHARTGFGSWGRMLRHARAGSSIALTASRLGQSRQDVGPVGHHLEALSCCM